MSASRSASSSWSRTRGSKCRKNIRSARRRRRISWILVDFGAFAKLEGGIEGLIHISELSDQHVNSPGDVVRVGDVIDVKVINIDLQDRRIGLSRKAFLAEGIRRDADASSSAEGEQKQAQRPSESSEERAQPTGRTLADLVDEAQAKRENEE